MTDRVEGISDAVSEIFYSVAETGVLNLSDYYKLMSAALNEALDDQEIGSINRLLYFVRKRRIAVVDDIAVRFGKYVNQDSDYTELDLPILQVAIRQAIGPARIVNQRIIDMDDVASDVVG
ncbi:MAG: hypothetical protein GDA43_10795 [Hormoscilla sp. SP5CHS1]|nr:hypothetical protein [Hormoscilla sp. SP12CHS1]MBC6453636.1 hypothetical protein [Hormoscilla sp. SP5CHS1]